MDRVTVKKKQHTSSYPTYIPHDIMMQVLSRLPVTSLMRFKCVCKLWQTMICDPEFCQLYRTLSETRLDGKYFVTFWNYRRRQRITLCFKNICFKNINGRSEVAPIELKLRNYEGQYNQASEPLDGLVCLYTGRTNNHALVLNLSTRQIVYLPKNGFSDMFFCNYFLGFDPMSGDYKVLNFYEDHLHNWRCDIYTLGTPSWRKICEPPRILRRISSGNCVNGTIYWLALEGDNGSVIAFDVGKEVFRTIRFTPSVPYFSKKLFAVGGQLVTPRLNNILVPGRNQIGFSFLEGYDKNEVLVKEDIDFPANLKNTDDLRISGVSPTGEIVLVDNFSSRNVYYHPTKKTWREDSFEWTQPTEKNASDLRPLLDRHIRYVCVKNIVRLKDRS